MLNLKLRASDITVWINNLMGKHGFTLLWTLYEVTWKSGFSCAKNKSTNK